MKFREMAHHHTFNSSKVCESTHNKKREVFDVDKQRIEGTEAEEFMNERNDNLEAPKIDWKKNHEDMIKAIREAKKGPRPASALDPPVEIRA